MDTELLKTFLEVNRTRHFGHAADNLYVSQSAVSARVRQLEDLVGVPLFTRTRNDIQLTATGQKLVIHAERILNSWNRARQEIVVEDVSQVPLTVGGVPSLWDVALQDWLHWLHSAVPDASLQVEVMNQDLLMRRLQEGAIDLAFLFESPQMAQLAVTEVFAVPLAMVSTQPGQTAQQAISTDYVLVDWGTSFAVAHARHFPDAPSPRIRVSHGRVARSFLLACGGAAYLARASVTREIADGRLFLVQDAPEIMRYAYAAHPLNPGKCDLIVRVLSYFTADGSAAGSPAE